MRSLPPRAPGEWQKPLHPILLSSPPPPPASSPVTCRALVDSLCLILGPIAPFPVSLRNWSRDGREAGSYNAELAFTDSHWRCDRYSHITAAIIAAKPALDSQPRDSTFNSWNEYYLTYQVRMHANIQDETQNKLPWFR